MSKEDPKRSSRVAGVAFGSHQYPLAFLFPEEAAVSPPAGAPAEEEEEEEEELAILVPAHKRPAPRAQTMEKEKTAPAVAARGE